MTTTDTDALFERIRRARVVPAEWARLREGESNMEQIERHQHRMDEQTAALITEEVRKAKAEALRGHAQELIEKATDSLNLGNRTEFTILLVAAEYAQRAAREIEEGVVEL